MDEDFKAIMIEMFQSSLGYQLAMWNMLMDSENEVPSELLPTKKVWLDPFGSLPDFFWNKIHPNMRTGVLGSLRTFFATNFTEELLNPFLEKSTDSIRLQFIDGEGLSSHEWIGFTIRSHNLSLNIMCCEDDVSFSPLVLTERVANSILSSTQRMNDLTLHYEYFIAIDLISNFKNTPALLNYLWVSKSFDKSESILLQPTVEIPDYGLEALQITEEGQKVFLQMLTEVLGAKINPDRYPEKSAKLFTYNPETTRIFFKGDLKNNNWCYFLYTENFQAEVMSTAHSSTETEICFVLRREGLDFGEQFPVRIPD